MCILVVSSKVDWRLIEIGDDKRESLQEGSKGVSDDLKSTLLSFGTWKVLKN